MEEYLLLFLTHAINKKDKQKRFEQQTASRFRCLQGRVAERSEATLSTECARKQRQGCCVVFINARFVRQMPQANIQIGRERNTDGVAFVSLAL